MLHNDGSNASYQLYLLGGGEMGELTRAHDWSKTVMGTPETWSRNLLTTLSIILNSKFPMLLWWGPDLIQFYNDAYRTILGNEGKHPVALGQPAKGCWTETWHIIQPMVDHVLSGGDAIWQEDKSIPLYRNGKMEVAYWTFCYSRVVDVDGSIGGVLTTCNETTTKVLQQQENEQTLLELAKSKEHLSNLIVQAPIGIGVLKTRALIIATANEKILQFWGKTNKVIGQSLALALPELDGQPFLQILDDVYTSGIPYVNKTSVMLEKDGVLGKYYFDISYQPIENTDGSIDSILVLATDLTAQVNALQIVKDGAMQLRQMADSIIQMVWITDAAGMHEYYNKRWYDFTGADFETSKGEAWQMMFHPDDRDKAWEKWNHSLKTGEPYEIEYRLKNAAGEYIWVLGRAAPFYNSENKIVKWFGTCTDINDQKLMLEMQDDFISTASHELKTPVTVLKAYLQLMLRAKNPSAITDLIPKVNSSANKIFDLVDELLDVSKLSHGAIVLSKTLFNLSVMVSECCEHLTLENRYKLNVVGNLDLEVHADLRRIQQVLTNLVNNAIKYASESSQILVEIDAFVNFAKVSVRDYGVGISKDKLPYLFDRYYRVNDSGGKQGGLGLGLYICSEIIKQHGGEIGVESLLNEGSTFWFTLPFDR